jgi:addiction module RelE/StbE family toxin
MDKYKIEISKPAEDDLREIMIYISRELLSPDTALEMLDTFDEEIKTLSTMPQRRPLVQDERLAKLGYRVLPIKNYLVFFTINKKKKLVDIERILYNRRNWKHLL